MKLYEVICKLMKLGIPFSMMFDGVDDEVVIGVGNNAVHFTSKDFNDAATWMEKQMPNLRAHH